MTKTEKAIAIGMFMIGAWIGILLDYPLTSSKPIIKVKKVIIVKQPKVNHKVILDWMIKHAKSNIPIETLKEIEKTTFQISKHPLLTLAIIATESSFDPEAYSKWTQDCGLMQINYRIWKDKLDKQNISKRQLFSIKINIMFGNNLVDGLIAKYGLVMGLAKYHGHNGLKYAQKVLSYYGQMVFIEKTMHQNGRD